MTTFIMTKEHADEKAKTLLNMKQAIVLLESLVPDSEVMKDGPNTLFFDFKGTRVYIDKVTEIVSINGRGGEAFRRRHLGFSPIKIKEIVTFNISQIEKEIEKQKAAKARNDIRRQRRMSK